VSVWATDGSVGRVVAEWRKLREHEALKGRKLYRNRDSVDPNVCSIMSGLSETSLHFVVTVCFEAAIIYSRRQRAVKPLAILNVGCWKEQD
jgi:hypothetical protein